MLDRTCEKALVYNVCQTYRRKRETPKQRITILMEMAIPMTIAISNPGKRKCKHSTTLQGKFTQHKDVYIDLLPSSRYPIFDVSI